VVHDNHNLSYSKLRELFIHRFGLRLVSPITEFTRLKYDSSKGVLEYYKTKRRLGTLAGLQESHIISLMIDGLPSSLSSAFIAIIPKTMDEFFEIASRAEINFKLREHMRTPNTNQNFQRPNVANFPKKRKPPSPCRTCENIGLKNRFHWANECFNRDNPSKRQKIVNNNPEKTCKKSLN